MLQHEFPRNKFSNFNEMSCLPTHVQPTDVHSSLSEEVVNDKDEKPHNRFTYGRSWIWNDVACPGVACARRVLRCRRRSVRLVGVARAYLFVARGVRQRGPPDLSSQAIHLRLLAAVVRMCG